MLRQTGERVVWSSINQMRILHVQLNWSQQNDDYTWLFLQRKQPSEEQLDSSTENSILRLGQTTQQIYTHNPAPAHAYSLCNISSDWYYRAVQRETDTHCDACRHNNYALCTDRSDSITLRRCHVRWLVRDVWWKTVKQQWMDLPACYTLRVVLAAQNVY